MKEYLDHTISLSSVDIDLWGNLKPTTILSICQEMAYMHATTMGFGYDALRTTSMAWVLSRVQAKIIQTPQWGDTITVRTWHKRLSGLFGLRDYIFYSADNKPIVYITSSWLIINIATRRIVRMDRVFDADNPNLLISHNTDAIEQEAPRVEIPSTTSGQRSHSVRYSDLDVNQHVNNAKYMEWACDSSPMQMEQSKHLSSFVLNFNHEAKLGDVVDISSCDVADQTIMIKGDCDSRNIFAFELSYR